MTPEIMAEIHAACFTMPRPWSTAEFSQLLANPLVNPVETENGFALTRTTGPEAELLTIAVRPNAQGQGYGRQILTGLIESLQHNSVKELFLEVAETNAAAIALYESAGFKRIGKRDAYYQAESDKKVAAIVMKLTISA